MSRANPGGLPWLLVARSYVGTKEVPGKGTSPVIAKWLRELHAWWDGDSVPWCGTFVAACLSECGLGRPQHWYRARAYLDWGVMRPIPTYGAIVVYERDGGGHVGFVVGRDDKGRILTLGGNQDNAVSIAPFDQARVLGYRWPVYANGAPAPMTYLPLPRFASLGPSSKVEA